MMFRFLKLIFKERPKWQYGHYWNGFAHWRVDINTGRAQYREGPMHLWRGEGDNDHSVSMSKTLFFIAPVAGVATFQLIEWVLIRW